MNDKNGFTISNSDHVLRAWQNSTELVRDYQDYAHETENEDKKLSELFARFAEEEAVHAAKLLEWLQKHEKE